MYTLKCFLCRKTAAPSFTCVCLQASPRQYCGDVRSSQQRAEAVNGASMCNCQLLNFLILICGHIRKCFSHHYCVNIWTHIERKVLTLELSSESTLKNHCNISTGLNATERFFLFFFFFFVDDLLF